MTEERAAALADAIGALVDERIKAALEKNGAGGGPIEPRLLSLKQAGEYMARSGESVRAMIATGELPQACVKKIGHRVFIVKRNLDAWISSR